SIRAYGRSARWARPSSTYQSLTPCRLPCSCSRKRAYCRADVLHRQEMRSRRTRRPVRPLLWGLSIFVVAAACIPAVYLLVRANQAADGAWRLLLTERSLLLLGNTLGLAFTVTTLAAL